MLNKKVGDTMVQQYYNNGLYIKQYLKDISLNLIVETGIYGVDGSCANLPMLGSTFYLLHVGSNEDGSVITHMMQLSNCNVYVRAGERGEDGVVSWSEWTELGAKIDITQFAPAVHTHDDKANSVHTHTKAQITDFPTSLPANGGNSATVGGINEKGFVQMPPVKLSVDNLNNANYPVAYRTTISNGTQIGLPVASWYHIDYYRHLDNNGYGYQVAYPLNHNGAVMTRGSTGTAWKAWVKVYDSNNKPTPAEIGALPTSGGTITSGIVKAGTSTSWIDGAKGIGALIHQNTINGYSPIMVAKTAEGSWAFGVYTNNNFHITYCTDVNMSANTNTTTYQHTFLGNGGLNIANSNGTVKRTYISTANPSGGANGDVWIKYA